jgi:hypothetical protein
VHQESPVAMSAILTARSYGSCTGSRTRADLHDLLTARPHSEPWPSSISTESYAWRSGRQPGFNCRLRHGMAARIEDGKPHFGSRRNGRGKLHSGPRTQNSCGAPLSASSFDNYWRLAGPSRTWACWRRGGRNCRPHNPTSRPDQKPGRWQRYMTTRSSCWWRRTRHFEVSSN